MRNGCTVFVLRWNNLFAFFYNQHFLKFETAEFFFTIETVRLHDNFYSKAMYVFVQLIKFNYFVLSRARLSFSKETRATTSISLTTEKSRSTSTARKSSTSEKEDRSVNSL